MIPNIETKQEVQMSLNRDSALFSPSLASRVFSLKPSPPYGQPLKILWRFRLPPGSISILVSGGGPQTCRTVIPPYSSSSSRAAVFVCLSCSSRICRIHLFMWSVLFSLPTHWKVELFFSNGIFTRAIHITIMRAGTDKSSHHHELSLCFFFSEVWMCVRQR